MVGAPAFASTKTAVTRVEEEKAGRGGQTTPVQMPPGLVYESVGGVDTPKELSLIHI